MPDLNDLTEDQLLDLMRNPEKIAEAAAEPEPEPSPEPEPPAEEDPEPEAEPEPAAEPEPEDFDRQELLAQIAELTARQRSQEAKLGKFAGEADYWRRKAQEVAQAGRQPEPEPTYLDDSEQATAPALEAPTRRDGTTEWVLHQAVETGLMQFAQQNPDTEQLVAEMSAYLQANGYGNGEILQNAASPMEAQRETFRAMAEAYWHVKTEKAAEARAAVETRRAEQFTRQREAKQRASVSASGSTQAPPPKAKTLNDMSEKELLSELDRLLAG